MADLENFLKIKQICLKIVENRNKDDILDLRSIIRQENSWSFLQNLQRDLLATFYLVLKNVSEHKSKLSSDDKLVVVEILEIIFSHTKVGNKIVFFNFFGFFLYEIYDQETHKIKNISEEYKLAILCCVKVLLNSTSYTLSEELYTKENGKRLCKMIYVAVETAVNEKFRKLRLEAIECLMALFKVYSENDYNDVVLRQLVAENFSFFLPGVALCLRDVALNDDNVGHKLIEISLKSMGRIISLLMQDYSLKDFTNPSMEEARQLVKQCLNQKNTPSPESEGSKNKVEEYMNATRNPNWFKKSDQYLSKLFIGYKKLTQYSTYTVRKELFKLCDLLIEKCSRTMPTSYRYLVEILIILMEDEDSEISQMSKYRIQQLASDSSNQQIFILNELMDGFQSTMSEIPSIFNELDSNKKITVIKLTSSYINLMGQNLQLHTCFREFMRIIVHLCEFEIDTSTFNTNLIEDLDSEECPNSDLWKNLKFLTEESLRIQFSSLCGALVKNDLFESVEDFLISVYNDDKREATYVLNELILGLEEVPTRNKAELLKPIFQLYTDPINWDLPLSVKCEEFDESLSLKTVRINIQQVALTVYGIGVMAEVLGKEFNSFLLKSLFLILTRAGSRESMIQSAGRKTLRNIASALGYTSVTALVNQNMDYIAFYIERGLKNYDSKGDSFNVLEVVMNYGNKITLKSLVYIIEEVLVQSCDRFKQKHIDWYLRVFQVFMKCVMRWFEITVPNPVMKSKAQKEEELLQSFKINGLSDIEEITDFSDNIIGKTAEELYKEDVERKQKEVEDELLEPKIEENKKPVPPYHIKLAVEILKRSLNFLPSKNKERKLLVLEILLNGVEIIKDYEDELLPIVHLIWSPLSARFKEIDVPVVINYSFNLLITLARVSKDFIRHRTSKDVLTDLLNLLTKLSKESYLKDRGSAYRYTQTYKLQLKLLGQLAYLVADLDLMEKDVEKTMDVVSIYLNNKQPIPLQTEALNFFKLIIKYEPRYGIKVRKWLEDKKNLDKKTNLDNILCSSED